MTQTFTHLRHHVAHDDLWFSIRAKHYAADRLIAVGDEPLTHLVPMPYCEKRISGKVLTSPVSFFSPSLATVEKWTHKEWRRLMSGLRGCRDWTIARFTMLTEQQAALLERHAGEHGMLTWATHEFFWIIPGAQSFEAYLKSRSSKFNANQRRCRRHMDTKGFSYSHDLDFDQIVKVYLSRQGQIASESHPDDYSIQPQFHAFLKELRDAYRKDGRWHECGVLNAEGELCAFVLSFRDKEGVFYCFQTCHNPAYHSLRLGAMAFEKTIEDALTQGCEYLSFTSDSHYFAQFTDAQFSFTMIEVFARSPRSYLIYFGRKLARLVKALKAARAARALPAAAPVAEAPQGARS